MKAIHFAAAALAAAVLLCGCATPVKGTDPITSLENRTCATKPDFALAIPLQVDAKDTKFTPATVDEKSPCFTDERGTSTYAVFAIPALKGQYTITVDSIPSNPALFATRVLLFDKDGVLKRTIQEKQITYRGYALSAVFRNHDDEQYIVAASDPKITGNTDNRIAGNTNVTMVCTGYGCFNAYSGTEAITNVVFSHNGKLSVSLIPIPPPKPAK